MKKQITALITYPVTGSKHLVCFNNWEWDGCYGIFKTYCFSGYVIDSESLDIGRNICVDAHLLTTHGLLNNDAYWAWDDDVEIIEFEYYPNWYDKLIGHTKY